MSNSLSKKLNLRVNDYPIILNERFNQSALRDHNIRKMGWFLRLKIKPFQNEMVYWCKNCILTYLRDDYNIAPVLSMPRTKLFATFMFGTSAYLFYQKEKLVKFTFHIIAKPGYVSVAQIDKVFYPQLSLGEFEKRIIESGIAPPSPIRTGVKICEIDNQALIIECPQNREPLSSGSIHLRFTSIPLLG